MKLFSGKFFSILLWAVLLCLVGNQAYQHYHNLPCRNPIEYKIGTLDPRFGVTRDQFLANIDQSGNLWSKAIGKKLFEYNPNSSLTINLIYDDRQKITQEEQSLTSSIDATKGVADSVKQQYTALKNTYQTAQVAYTGLLAQFNQKQNVYNAQVEQYNGNGGASPEEYRALQAQKSALTAERSTLEKKRLEVNNLGEQVNALIDKYNLLVGHINATVDAINNDGLSGTQFEEGVYISDNAGTRINIYQFNNKTFFIRVLAHELGHSLGLDHNDGADSIMSPVNKSKSLKLSTEDLAAITALCRER